MDKYTYSDKREQGTYKPTHDRGKVIVMCAGCGDPIVLDNHRVYDNGLVEPKLICPYVYCRREELLELVDWEKHNKESQC